MQYFTVGSINIPYEWLAFFCAYFIQSWRLRKDVTKGDLFFENVLWRYIVIWKLSYVLFEWSDFIQAPLSLLYFDGGWKGHLLALVLSMLVLWPKREEMQLSHIQMWVRFFIVFEGLMALFTQQWLFVALGLGAWLGIERAWRVEWLVVVFAYAYALYIEGWQHPVVWALAVLLMLAVYVTKNKNLVIVSGLTVLVVLMLGNVKTLSPTTATVQEISLPTTTGETYTLSQQNEALVVVNFFATWCPPCKAEMPHLQAFAENLPANTQFIGVNLTARDNGEEALKQFLSDYGVTYPILLDEADQYGSSLNILTIPTTIIYQNQQEVSRIMGPVTEERLRKIVQEIQ